MSSTSPPMPIRSGRFGTPQTRTLGLLVALGLVGGAFFRLAFIDYLSHDIIGHLGQWYDYIVIKGGYRALGDRFADYTPGYLYLLTAAMYVREYLLPAALSKIVAIKLPSLIFDLVLAYSVYKLVSLTQPRRMVCALAAVIVLLLPTVVVNSAMWGQADSMYVALALLGLYCLCIDQPVLAAIWIGLALALKAQTVFIAPALAFGLLKRRFTVWHVLVIGGVYALLALPVIMLGRPPLEALGSYVVQLNEYRQPSMGAPNPWSEFGAYSYHFSVVVGGLAALVASLCVTASFTTRPGQPSSDDIIACALVSSAVLPFVLPKMHERYFFLCDVLSVVIAFRRPKLWWLVAGYQLVSLSAYAGVLHDFFFAAWPRQVLSLRTATMLNGGLLVYIAWQFGYRAGSSGMPSTPGAWSRRLIAIGGVALGAIGVAARLAAPAFQRPPTWIAPNSMPADTVHTAIVFGDAVELAGYYLPEPHPQRAGVMKIDLFFRPLRKIVEPLSIRAEAFSLDGTSLELISDGPPDPPMSAWQVGELYIERRMVTIWPTVPAPQLATFRVSVLDQKRGEVLPFRCTPLAGTETGVGAEACTNHLGTLPISVDSGTASDWLRRQPIALFGSSINLLSLQMTPVLQAGTPLTATMTWRAVGPSGRPSTVFVHILTPEGRLAAQLDAPPRKGLYPTTVWHVGEVVVDDMSVPLPRTLASGRYGVRIGLYDSVTIQRLRALTPSGRPLPDDEFDAGEITVR